MVFSPLISGTIPHHGKYSSRQGQPIVGAVIHHWAGLSGGDKSLASPSRNASTNLLIFNDGTVKGQVPEEYRAWTSGSFAADGSRVTIEIQNSSGQVSGNDNDPNSWKISDAAYNSLLRVLADLAKRYKWGAVAQSNTRYHREFQATSCPGGYIWNRRVLIANDAHKLFLGKTAPKVDAPKTPPATGKSIWVLADEVLQGVHGSGDARKKSLGGKYQEVQSLVNTRLGLSAPGKPIAPDTKSIDQLVDEVLAGAHGSGEARKKSLGSQYAKVQEAVNVRLGVSKPKATQKKAPNIAALANKVLLGHYGNGAKRKALLGANYNAVQAEVNRRLNAR